LKPALFNWKILVFQQKRMASTNPDPSASDIVGERRLSKNPNAGEIIAERRLSNRVSIQIDVRNIPVASAEPSGTNSSSFWNP